MSRASEPPRVHEDFTVLFADPPDAAVLLEHVVGEESARRIAQDNGYNYQGGNKKTNNSSSADADEAGVKQRQQETSSAKPLSSTKTPLKCFRLLAKRDGSNQRSICLALRFLLKRIPVLMDEPLSPHSSARLANPSGWVGAFSTFKRGVCMARLAHELAEEEPSMTGVTGDVFSAFYTRYVQVGTALLELIQENARTEAVGREQNSGETVRSKPRHQGQKGWKYRSTYVSEATLQLMKLDQSFHRMVLEKKQNAAGGAEKNKSRKRKAGTDSTTTVVRTVAAASKAASETQDQQGHSQRRRRVAFEHPAPSQQSPQSLPPPPPAYLKTQNRQRIPNRNQVHDLDVDDGCGLDKTTGLLTDDPSRELHNEDMTTLDQLFPYPHPATAHRHLNTQQSQIDVQKDVPPMGPSQGQEAPSTQSSHEQEALSTQSSQEQETSSTHLIQEQQEYTHSFDQISPPTSPPASPLESDAATNNITADNNSKDNITTTTAIVEDNSTDSADEILEPTYQLLRSILMLEETMRSFSHDIKAQMTQMTSTLEAYQLQMTQLRNSMETQQTQMTQFRESMETQQAQMPQVQSAIKAQQMQMAHLRNSMMTQQSGLSGVQDTLHALNKRSSLSGSSNNSHRTLATPNCDVLTSTTAISPTRSTTSGARGARAGLADARGGTPPPSPPPSAGPSRPTSTLTLGQTLTIPWNSNLTSTSSSVPNAMVTVDSPHCGHQGHTSQQAPTSHNADFDTTAESLVVSAATMSVMGTGIRNESRTGSHRPSHQESIKSSSESGPKWTPGMTMLSELAAVAAVADSSPWATEWSSRTLPQEANPTSTKPTATVAGASREAEGPAQHQH